MTLDLLVPLGLYAFATSITPGPNNMMLAASGANFGVRPTMPHAVGVTAGCVLIQVLACLGVVDLVRTVPGMDQVLNAVGLAYLLYLAFCIATATTVTAEGAGAPIGFLGAVSFQFVNPKAVMMALTAASTFPIVPAAPALNAAAVAVVFAAINFPCVLTWAAFGARMRRVLDRGGAHGIFNLAMAALVAGSGLFSYVWWSERSDNQAQFPIIYIMRY